MLSIQIFPFIYIRKEQYNTTVKKKQLFFREKFRKNEEK